jgi:hypothetical protein
MRPGTEHMRPGTYAYAQNADKKLNDAYRPKKFQIINYILSPKSATEEGFLV